MDDGERITPFRIEVAQPDIDDLARRLEASRWPDELPDVGWDYGVASAFLRELADHWRSEYDWPAHERRLNALPHFVTVIDGQSVHFVHQRSATPGALPLLITHGWPSTFADFEGMIGPLTDPAAHGADGAPAFDVIVPSLPGFGFSGPTRERGWGISRIARAWAELMRRLGYERYLVQGGDFGGLVSPEVGRVAPASVIGVHVNALVTLGAIDWQSEDPTAGLTEAEVAKVYAAAARWRARSGYAAIQSSRPQTLAYALSNSPLGLLAWNLEWFVDYDPARNEQVAIDPDAILTDVTICWHTNTAGSSARLYKEASAAFTGGARSGVPTAVAVFPGDAAIRSLAERSHKIVRWTEYDRGGHFASLQAPDLLLDDIREFADELR